MPIELARLRHKHKKMLESRSLSPYFAIEVRREEERRWMPAALVGPRQLFDNNQLQALIEGEKAAIKFPESEEIIEVALDAIRVAPDRQDCGESGRPERSRSAESSTHGLIAGLIIIALIILSISIWLS